METCMDLDPIVIQHAFQHNIYVKQTRYPKAGTSYKGHYHDYDHVTLVASGSVEVKFVAVPELGIPEEIQKYSAVDMFVTRCYRLHEITSLEDNTVICCVHAIRDLEDNIVTVKSQALHNPNEKFDSWRDAQAAVKDGRKIQVFGGIHPRSKLLQLMDRAIKEGVADPGSQDLLL